MKKVYCKNCEHNGGRKTIPWQWCEAPQLSTETGSEYAGFYGEKELTRKRELNLRGECPHYKRKWWKFWLKNH